MKLYPPIVTALLLAAALCAAAVVNAADVVPDTIQQPGTQPGEISNLESPDKCDNCHGGYNPAVEPAHNWRGSMMAHAGRDPIFWATLAIAEQDFDGAGDLCIRCHSTAGWLAGRSTPTDGSGLAAGDSDGVECDFCHKMTNPDDSEHPGLMSPDFVANEPNEEDPFDWDEPNGVEGYYGSGMASMWAGSDKLGPFDNAEARHQFMQSKFHRDRDFCGSCHDVSNPAVGDLAHNHGTQPTADAIDRENAGNPNNSLVAFNNPPYRYGIVERTFSEYKSGRISQTLVTPFSGGETNIYGNLPDELKSGALEAAYNAATRNGTISGHYSNPSMPRYFSCQTCHLRAVQGTGANKNGVPVRDDLPLHDMTGGNYWMPQAIAYLDSQGKLRLGGGMSASQVTAMLDGALRAKEQLELAATLTAQEVNGNVKVRIANHTGHKLISGYPEGRRMWLRTTWFDSTEKLLKVDGDYGNMQVSMDINGDNSIDSSDTVRTILDLEGGNTRIYEAHMGMTKEWAQQLKDLGYPDGLALGYDRVSGAVAYTLIDLVTGTKASHETFHFVLNNTVVKDNRIPPYGMDYESARVRNALPVPANQYGVGDNPQSGDTYNYFDEVTLTPPADAVSATIELLYQPTSWEYIQFLYLANNGGNAFLADEGSNMLEAWLNTGMAEPHVMASASWGTNPPTSCEAPVPQLTSATAGDAQVALVWSDETAQGASSYSLYYDQSGKAQLVAGAGGLTVTSHTDTGLTNGQEYCYKVTSTTSGEAACESGFSNILCANPSQPGLEVTVPDVTDLSQSDAEADILAAQLSVGTVGEDYSDTLAGLVISQTPSGGTTAQRGSEVDLVVSLGPAPTPSCSALPDKASCNNEPLCTWQGSPRSGSCVEIDACTVTENPEISCNDGTDNDCDGLIDSADPDCGISTLVCSDYNGDQASCQDQAACRWSRKDSLCLTR